ncbi:hypothetical protein JCM8208_005642 [Rhodotorula glutinis]
MLASHGHGDPPPPYALDLLALDPDGVHRLFADLGFAHYRDQLQDHGISGDVLIHLDHAALKDVGVHSVGQRLAILKAVYDLKVAQDIPIEDGHYVPPSEDLDGAGPLPAYQILGLLSERDERIHRLESEVHSLHSALVNLREDSLNVARGGGPSSKPRPSVRSPTGLGFVHPLSNSSTLSRSSSTPSRPRNPPPVAPLGSSSLALPQPHHAGGGGLPDSPHSPVVDSPRTMGDYQSQQQLQHGHGQQYQTGSGHAHHHEPHLQPAEISISGVATPTTPTAPMLIHPDSAAHHGGGGGGGTPNSHLHPASSSSSRPDPSPTSATTTTPTSSSLSTLSPSASTSRTREGSSTSTSASTSAADNPYRSFRVTVEDPCYKVLPAALKKYKINDDWRLYALFICYGNTERCLAYDEKPLLLFQKLKESNDNPVFMLRHIKDIKSPIAVATAKHAARKDKRPAGIGGGVDRSLMGTNRDGSAAAASAAVVTANPANGLQANARPTRLHHPPVLLPVGKDKDKDKDKGAAGDEASEAGAEGGSDKKDEGAGATPAGKKAQGYCIAIYPYLAEREDEFDVAVGDTFVILSKTKGWWVVHRDYAPAPSSSTSTSSSSPSAQLSSSTSSNPDPYSAAPRKSAWVPAGCLLETSVPPLSLFGASAAATGEASSPSAAKTPTSATSTFAGAPSSSSTSTSTSVTASAASAAAGVPAHEGNAALVPIPPALVVSVSTPGVALMDYVRRGAGELEVRKGATLRILKRYNHWSYAVKDDGGRGWLPSWFCGRVNKADAAAAGAGAGAGAAGGGGGAGAGGTTPTTPVAPESGHASSASTAAGAASSSSSSAPHTASSTAGGGSATPRPATAPGGAPKPPLSVNVPPLLPGASGGARSAGAAMMLEPLSAEETGGGGGGGGGAGGAGATAGKEEGD